MTEFNSAKEKTKQLEVDKHTLEIKKKELECMVESLNGRLQDREINSKDTNRLVTSKDSEILSLNKRVQSLEIENTRLQKTIDDMHKQYENKQ